MMATANSLLCALDHLLTCPVCANSFSAEGVHKPKLTPCNHTFCESCLKTLLFLQRPCPSCRGDLGTVRSVSDLSSNITLIQTLEALAASDTAASGRRREDSVVSCHSATRPICGACPSVATHKCHQCPEGGEWLCDTHRNEHNNLKISRHHRPVILDHLTFLEGESENDLPGAESLSGTLCLLHVQEKKIYCETCRLPICQLCALSKLHRMHDVDVLSDWSDKQRQILAGKLELSRQTLALTLLPSIVKITEAHDRVRLREEELKVAVRFQSLRFTEWRGRLQSEIREKTAAKLSSLEQLQWDLNKRKNEIMGLIQATEEFLVTGRNTRNVTADCTILELEAAHDRLGAFAGVGEGVTRVSSDSLVLFINKAAFDNIISEVVQIVDIKEPMVWDHHRVSRDLACITDRGTTCSGTVSSGWFRTAVGAAKWASGIHAFAVQLTFSSREASVGIGNSAVNIESGSFPLCLKSDGTGTIRATFQSEDRVSVLLNICSNRVLFFVNSTLVGECCLDIAKPGPFSPMASFYSCKDTSVASFTDFPSGVLGTVEGFQHDRVASEYGLDHSLPVSDSPGPAARQQ